MPNNKQTKSTETTGNPLADESLHSNECSPLRGKNKADYEEAFGIAPMLKALKDMGWDRWQWHNYSRADLDKYKHATCFIEMFGDHFKGMLRGDSNKNLKEAVEHVLNKAMRMNKCEMDTGHSYTTAKGYTNGLMECSNCGFMGYTNLFQIKMSEISHYKMVAQMHQEEIRKQMQVISEFGMAFNGFGGMLILDKVGEKKHSFLRPKPLDQVFLTQLRDVFIKNGYLGGKDGD